MQDTCLWIVGQRGPRDIYSTTQDALGWPRELESKILKTLHNLATGHEEISLYLHVSFFLTQLACVENTTQAAIKLVMPQHFLLNPGKITSEEQMH